MTFISYAQNYEDVMLWRALKHVGRGFYIDAGAWSPDVDSVTKAFYENGWRGINIEPNPECHAQLEKKRPHDANLCVAVGDAPGFAEFNLLSDSGLSTLDDAIARSHVAAGRELERMTVRVTTLAEIWKDHVPAKQEVHFLKIDVEGFEERALRGNDWKQCRPWIVVVEATLPMEETELYDSWEPILLNDDYAFAYADGLNRFYVAREHDELLPAFQYPPNYFDHFRPHALVVAEAKAQDAESRVRQVESRTQWLQDQWNAMQARLETLAAQESAAKAETARFEARLAEKSEALTKAQQALAEKSEAITKAHQGFAEMEQALTAAQQALAAQESAAKAETARFEARLAEKSEALTKAQQALAEQQRQTSTLQNKTIEAQGRIAELDRSLQHWRSVAENLDRQIQAIYKSRSWRITKPYRFTGNFVRRLSTLSQDGMRRLGIAIESLLRSLLLAIMRAVYRRPRLNDWLKQRLERYPRLWERLALQARDAGLFTEWTESLPTRERDFAGRKSRNHSKPNDELPAGEGDGNTSKEPLIPREENAEVLLLSARARRVYRDLKRSIESQKREAG